MAISRKRSIIHHIMKKPLLIISRDAVIIWSIFAGFLMYLAIGIHEPAGRVLYWVQVAAVCVHWSRWYWNFYSHYNPICILTFLTSLIPYGGGVIVVITWKYGSVLKSKNKLKNGRKDN